MPDGQLTQIESIWSQLLYANRTLSPIRLVLKASEGYIFSATSMYSFFLYLESIRYLN